MNEQEFMRGQKDCKNGKPHKDQGEDYNRGYAAQYAMEQALGHKGFN